jgi:hypothetical protein
MCWLLAVGVALGGAAPGSIIHAAPPPAGVVRDARCFVATTTESLAVPGGPRGPESPTPSRPSQAREERRPPSERELRLLIRDFAPAGTGDARGRVRAGSGLSLPRVRVLLDDVSALLAVLQARETLEELNRRPPAAERAWLQKTLQGLSDCVRGGFNDRGGEGAFSSSLGLVERYRRELEPLLLGAPHLVPLAPMPRAERDAR